MKPLSTTAKPGFAWSGCWKRPTSRSVSGENWSTSDPARFVSLQIAQLSSTGQKQYYDKNEECNSERCRKDRTTVKPTVLVAATSRWYPTARLVMALASAGCEV